MLQNTEPVEIPSSGVSAAVTTEILPGEVLPAQDMDAELAELAAHIQASVTRSKNHTKSFLKTNNRKILLVFGPIMIALVACLFAMQQGMLSPTVMMWAALASFPLSMLGSGVLSRWHPNLLRAPEEQERLTAQRLAEIDDVRAVPLLFDALRSSADRTANPPLWQALGRLLPRLTVEQARALGPERHGRMVLWIQSWDRSPHDPHHVAIGNQPALGVLHVLAQLGQSSLPTYHPVLKAEVPVLEIVRTWADGQKLGEDPVVQKAAAACFEAIQNKMALVRSSAQLLRASTPTASSPESLLRPAQGTQQTDPQELLRAAPTNKQDTLSQRDSTGL